MDVSMNVTTRRSRRTGRSERQLETERTSKRKSSEDEEEINRNQENALTNREMTFLDENRADSGRQCSTPIKNREEGELGDVTFSLNLSAITEKEELKNRSMT